MTIARSPQTTIHLHANSHDALMTSTMSNDVGQETTFSAIFPLPYRVLSLAGLGILAWAVNLHGLHLAGIDAARALDLDPHRARNTLTNRSPSPLPTVSRSGWKHVSATDSYHVHVYKLFLQYSVCVTISWLIYRNATNGDVGLVDVFKYIPAVTALVLLVLLICPFDLFQKHERDRFFRCVIPIMARNCSEFLSSLCQARCKDVCLAPEANVFISPMSFSPISSHLLPRSSGTSGFQCVCFFQEVVFSRSRPKTD